MDENPILENPEKVQSIFPADPPIRPRVTNLKGQKGIYIYIYVYI